MKNIDGKTITSAGGIVVALALIGLIYSNQSGASNEVLNTKVDNLGQSFSEFKNEDTMIKKELTNALVQNAKAIEGNTKVMEQVLRK